MKKALNAVIEIGKKEEKEPKIVTEKKYLKRAENIVRRLDNVVTQLNKLAQDARDLEQQTELPVTEVSEKDYNRITELTVVLEAATNILFQVDDRMARKYVGKNVDPLDLKKRDSLKIK